MEKEKYVFSKEDAIEMLIVALELNDLIPKTGFGRAEHFFDNGILIDSKRTENVKIKIKVSDVLKKFLKGD